MNISVIIPTKNSESYLRQCLESVCENISLIQEIIVIDKNSTDRTESIVKEYPKTSFKQQIGTGLSSAWNQGIASSRADFLAFIDSDDYWEKNKLAVCLKPFGSRPELGYVISKMRFFLESGYEIPQGFRASLLNQPIIGRVPGTLVARRAVFDQVGCFNEDLKIAGDVDWFARAVDLEVAMEVIDQVLLHKRIHDSNLSNNAEKNTQELRQLLLRSIKRKQNSDFDGNP